eukprot:COSAG05_NODE_9922_length_593_cov_0.858300_1_plen_22_part_10
MFAGIGSPSIHVLVYTTKFSVL